MLCAVLSTQAATPAKLYIFGDTPFGGWSYNPISQGTAVEMTKDGNKFTWTGSISTTCYFAFLSQDGTDWNSLNSNYRLSSTVQAIALDTEYALSTGDRSMKLMPGDYTITVDYTSGSPKLKATGYVPEIVITGYSLIGAKELFGGNGWDTDVDLTETSTGVYTATVSNVSLAAGSYEYKARANHDWGIAEYPASGNNSLTITEAGTYNIVFTLTLATSTLTAEATKVGDDAPEITDLYLVGEFNSWAAQDANYKFTKREDGKFEFTMNGYVAEQKFKFVDNNGTWYGSATWKDEAITEDNCDNIALGVGGVDNNFYALTNGSAVLTVDLSAMTFSVEPTEVVLPEEATYIEGKNFVYFEAPATWDETVYAYTYDAAEGVAAKAPRKVSAAWPGDAMELVTTSAAGNKVYRYTTEDTDFNTIIFTDGTNQTANLAFSNAGYYMAVGLVATVPSTSTGIDSLTDQTATQTSAQMYTIDGRRVNAPLSKGLYITNGKKVMIGK